MTTKMVGWIVLGVVVLGGIYLVASKGNSGMPADGEVKMNTLQDLIAGGKSITCTVDDTIEGVKTVGSVFVADGSLRGDFSSTPAGAAAPIESHMITNGKKLWVWSSLMPQGFEMDFDMTAAAQTSASQSNQGSVGFDQKLNYSCKSWTVDQSKFQKPAGINFMTMPTVPATY